MEVDDFIIKPSYQVLGLAAWECVAFGLCVASGQIQGMWGLAALIPMSLVCVANWLHARGW